MGWLSQAITPAAARSAISASLRLSRSRNSSALCSPSLGCNRVMRAGERQVLEADREIVVIVGDAGAFAYAINQRPGRSLGASGEVKTATITRGNYRSYTTQ